MTCEKKSHKSERNVKMKLGSIERRTKCQNTYQKEKDKERKRMNSKTKQHNTIQQQQKRPNQMVCPIELFTIHDWPTLAHWNSFPNRKRSVCSELNNAILVMNSFHQFDAVAAAACHNDDHFSRDQWDYSMCVCLCVALSRLDILSLVCINDGHSTIPVPHSMEITVYLSNTHHNYRSYENHTVMITITCFTTFNTFELSPIEMPMPSEGKCDCIDRSIGATKRYNKEIEH